jgi:uncharacterized protein YjbI with pentapeptide repeats
VANEEHLQKLQAGPVAWNHWRADNLEVKPDLSGANLARADLTGADFTGADFTGADFTGADLTGTRGVMTGRA